jgi:hypothetical protein
MTNNYAHYYIELTNKKVYEVFCPEGEDSDGFNYLEQSLFTLADNGNVFVDIQEVEPVYASIHQLPSMPEWFIKGYLESEDSPYIEDYNGVCTFYYGEVEHFTVPAEFDEYLYDLYQIRQEERLKFADFVKTLGYESPQEVQGQDYKVAHDVVRKWCEYEAENAKKEMQADYDAAKEGRFTLTFNEFIHTLGYESAKEVDYAGATHDVVGAWLDYVNSNKQ